MVSRVTETFIEIWYFVLAGAFGAVIASFLNVLAYRGIAESDGELASGVNAASGSAKSRKLQKSRRQKISEILTGHSVCESCEKKLTWIELLPVIGWFIIRGKCSKCRTQVSISHPVSEFVLGGVFAVTWWKFSYDLSYDPMTFAWILGLVVLMYLFSAYDLFRGIVPDVMLFPVIAIVLVVRLLHPGFGDYILAAAMYGLFFAVVNWLSMSGVMPGVNGKKQGFGWGDAKYALLVGLVLGVSNTLVAWWIGIFSGAFVGGILMLSRRRRKIGGNLSKMPYVPFMSFGAWVALLWGEQIIQIFRWYFLF